MTLRRSLISVDAFFLLFVNTFNVCAKLATGWLEITSGYSAMSSICTHYELIMHGIGLLSM